MREIKFRAWDKVKREWFKSIHHIPEGVELSEAVISANVLSLMSQAPFKVMCEKYDFCQFTGLKDKNGKEIYEGDIVRMQQIQGICEFIGVIHIGADPARPHDCRVWVDTSHEEKARKHGIGGKYVFIHNEPEVIGNIYENIELVHNSQKH